MTVRERNRRAYEYIIRVAARDNPAMLGFPVVRVGSRTKIPRIPFLQVMGGTREEMT